MNLKLWVVVPQQLRLVGCGSFARTGVQDDILNKTLIFKYLKIDR